MIIGFTGTRNGMTSQQISTVSQMLIDLYPEEVHHGDCIGADAQFHAIAQSMGTEIIGHPASGVGEKRAYCQGFAEILEEKPPLERNHDIVDESDIMIATPKGYSEERRSGTWATIRYARNSGKKVYVVLPDGSIEEQ